MEAAAVDLRAARSAAMNLVEGFNQDFIVLATGDVRKKYQGDNFCYIVMTFARDLGPKVDDLETANARFAKYLAIASQIATEKEPNMGSSR